MGSLVSANDGLLGARDGSGRDRVKELGHPDGSLLSPSS